MAATKTGLKKLLLAVIGLLGLCIIVPLSVRADNVVQGFSSAQALQPGLVVALDKNSSNTVLGAPYNDPTRIYGVVVDPSDAPFILNNSNAHTYVATSGIYQVLVSTSNGAVKAGDYLSMSNNNGIAAKATNVQSTVLGQAESAFDGKSGVITTNGNSDIGRVYVNINVGQNPLANSSPAVPLFLKKAANSLANKPVSVVRIYTGLVIFLVAAVAAVTVMWSGVKNGLVSLGRNPLSRQTIFSGIYKVIFTGLAIFIIGLAGVYLLLKV